MIFAAATDARLTPFCPCRPHGLHEAENRDERKAMWLAQKMKPAGIIPAGLFCAFFSRLVPFLTLPSDRRYFPRLGAYSSLGFCTILMTREAR